MSEDHARRIQARKREDDAERMWIINIILVVIALFVAAPFIFAAFDFIRQELSK